MKLACFSAMAPDIPIETLVPLLGKTGYLGIELAVGYPNALWGVDQWHVSLANLESEVGRLKQLAAVNDLKIVGLSTPPVDTNTQLCLLESAAALGCEFVRIGCLPYESKTGYANLYGKMRGILSRLLEGGLGRSPKLLVETHPGNITSSASLARRLMEDFNPEQVGVIWDPGNQIMEGFENPCLALDLLGPYLAHVHVKNLGWQRVNNHWQCLYMRLSEGMADWEKIINLLQDTGYQGWLSVEDFRGGYCRRPTGITTEQKLQEDFAFLKAILEGKA